MIGSAELTVVEKLRLRSALYNSIRAFFAATEVAEVNTAVLSAFACPEPMIEVLKTNIHLADKARDYYLQTSPEFAMKKLIAAGSGSIFQMCPVFRDSDIGRYHHPEFTMLEWYRTGFDHHQLIAEVESLIKHVFQGHRNLQPSQHLSYQTAFIEAVQLDPLTASVDDCVACCDRFELNYPSSLGDDVDQWLDLIISHLVTPNFAKDALTVIYDYPASQAALAKTRYDEGCQQSVAERFEVYLGPVELANGFNELVDAQQQLQRFQNENQQRQQNQQQPIEIDLELIAALESGMPACAGVALGLERLLMVMHQIEHINSVILFPLTKS